MNFHKFIALVEPPTLIASCFPFMLGIIFVGFNENHISIFNSLILLLACALLQAAVNVNDNLSDYRLSFKTDSKDFRKRTNALGVNQISTRAAAVTAVTLLILVIIPGIYLMFATTFWLLLIGVIGILIGYFYARGNHPITYTPFGELASGLTMGLGIFYATMLVNIPKSHLSFQLFCAGLLAALFAVFPIANIMLANNICDQEEDKQLKRHTLVSYLGKQNSLYLFVANYALAYLTLFASMIIGWLPWWMLITFVGIPKIYRRCRKFFAVQVKNSTFILAVQNTMTMFALTVLSGVVEFIISFLFP